MPELKNTFTGGKMEKDLDERIVPTGQYREALNIGVATSEDSDVGAAQNILGNIKVTSAIQGRTQTNESVGDEYDGYNSHIAEFVNPQSDMLYRFVHTASPIEGIWMDRIVEYDTTKSLDDHWETKENAVFVDIFKVEASISNADLVCESGNKTKIQINKNLNQLRWGMMITCHGEIPPNTTIEDIDYASGWITLDTACPGLPAGIIPVTFYGDRNLNFSPDRKITGINVIDGMIFWTDNYSEPKKIDIERSKVGSKTFNWTSTPGLIGRHSAPPKKIDDFNQHTVLVIGDTESPVAQTDCMKEESICPPVGCTDPLACNFDPAAMIDDGSCGGFGCTDSGAFNYDSTAACDDGTCCYIYGCTDPTACNYSADACQDDGSCYGTIGCMDSTANNYDPAATCNGGCTYNYGCLENNYGNDDCLAISVLSPVGIGVSDIFDPSNWFSFPSQSSAPTPAVLGAMFDAGSSMQTVPWDQRWYLNHVTIASTWGGTPHQTNGNCTYQLIDNDPMGVLPGLETALSKQKLDILKLSNPFYQVDENGNALLSTLNPASLQNSTGVNQGATSAMTSAIWSSAALESLTQTTNTCIKTN